jgi:hypothetical protein
VTFSGSLTGEEARAFFDHLGTVDPALWSGQFAGFTQIDPAGSFTNNSMLFLRPAVNKIQMPQATGRCGTRRTCCGISTLRPRAPDRAFQIVGGQRKM